MTAAATPTYVSVTDTAKLVRSKLKAAFPGVKFSVRSDSYAGGASIRVTWTDGPIQTAVDKVVEPYVGSTFDAMTDSKDYRRGALDDGSPAYYGADHIFTQRNLSPEFQARVTAAAVSALEHDSEAAGLRYRAADGSLVMGLWIPAVMTQQGLCRPGTVYALTQFLAQRMSP